MPVPAPQSDHSLPLVAAVRAAIRSVGDPERAKAQQAYMKSAMPYRGITNPELRILLRETFADVRPPDDRDVWEDAIRDLWDGAEFREERYAATALAQHRSAKAWQDPDALPLYRDLIVSGAWWDHVDDLATHSVAPILAEHRREVTPVIRAWATADNLWLRRTAIICQLPHKDQTDLDLLTEAIDANVEGTPYGTEFFIRKAIGWALRQHARTDPDWVRAFVAERPQQLSGLSRREALKHLG